MTQRTSLKEFVPNTPLPPPWKTFVKEDSILEPTGDTLRFVNTDTIAPRYTDAQIDD